MGRNFNFQRIGVAIGSLPDAEPNGTPPPSVDVFNSPGKTEEGAAAGAVQFGVSMNVAGTVDITLWMQDENSSVWFKAVTEVGVADKDFLEVVGVVGMAIFFQLTNPAGFATIALHAEVTP